MKYWEKARLLSHQGLSRQLHPNSIKTAKTPILLCAPAYHPNTAVCLKWSFTLGFRRKIYIDRIAWVIRAIRLQQDSIVRIIDYPRRKEWLFDKKVFDQAFRQCCLAR